MIVVKPIGGLGNRLRCIKSTLNLARKVNQQVKVYWDIDSGLKCNFEDLFEPCDLFEVENICHKVDLQAMAREASGSYLSLNWNYMEEHDLINEGLERYVKEHSFGGGYFIESCYEYYGIDNGIDYLWVKPVMPLQEKIKNICDKLGEYAIGIHIRRTDQKMSIHYSPTNAFISAMREEIRKNPNTVFYLASDDENEKKSLLEKFGNRIVMQGDIELRRNTLDGMQAAVIDLFCLANTNRIYGSYWSSFSEIAAQIKKAELVIVQI